MKQRLITGLAALLCMFSIQVLNAQDDYEDTRNEREDTTSVKGLYVGLNVGAYFANKHDAQLYNGYGFDRNGQRLSFSESWLNQQFNFPGGGSSNYPVSRQEITEEIANNNNGVSTTEDIRFTESDMPFEMVYDPGIMVGLHLRYNKDVKNAFLLDFNFTQLRASGEFTIDRPNYITADPSEGTLLYYPIIGQEQRFYLNLGYHRVFGDNEVLNWYGEIGANMTYAQFEENRIQVHNYDADITIERNFQGTQTQEAIEISSFGLGGFIGAGAQITLGDKFTVDLGYSLMNTRLDLVSNPERTFQHGVILRAIYM